MTVIEQERTFHRSNGPGRRAAGRVRVRRRVGVLVPGAVAAVLLAGCSSHQASQAGSAASGARAVAPASAGGMAADAAAPGGGAADSASPAPLTAPVLVRTAETTVRVADVGRAATVAVRVARDNGGALYGDDRVGTGADAHADLVLKVAPDRLDTAVTAVAGLGTEESRSSATQDVTGQVADVASRLATMRASIARVRVLLGKATRIGDVVTLEGELSRRETDLESLQAQQRVLAGRTSLATLTVHLLAPRSPVPPVQAARHGFLGGLSAGWDSFTATLGWLLTVLGAVLPFTLLALPVLLVWLALTRLRRPQPAPPAPAPAE